jgi:hypothetical protein
MGYRTTILIDNDHTDVLLLDQSIGKKIYNAVHGFNHTSDGRFGNLGGVIEQAHADVARLMVIGANGSFSGDVLASIPYTPHEDNPAVILLKEAAFELGYKLVKRSVKD